MKYRIERWATSRPRKRKVVFEIEDDKEVTIITTGFRCAAETEKIVEAVEEAIAGPITCVMCGGRDGEHVDKRCIAREED